MEALNTDTFQTVLKCPDYQDVLFTGGLNFVWDIQIVPV